MVIIAGHFAVAAERRDEYVATFTDLVRRARQAPGCLDVAVTADSLDAGRVYMYERLGVMGAGQGLARRRRRAGR